MAEADWGRAERGGLRGAIEIEREAAERGAEVRRQRGSG